MRLRRSAHFSWSLGLAAGIATADFASKALVQSNLAYGERIVLAPFFNLVHVLNSGAAFSFLAGAGGWQRPFLLVVGITVSAAIVYMLLDQRQSRLSSFALAAVLGGAIGNVIDRIRQGAVVDWLDFHVNQCHWPAFNLADIAICTGVAALLFENVLARPKKTSP